MICRICGKETKEEICETCFGFYSWKYEVKTIDEVLEIQDRRHKNVEKTIQKKKKRAGGKK